MSYRDMLVYLDPDSSRGSFIDCAVAFALSQNARLTGLHVIDIPTIPDYVKANLPQEVIENHRSALVKQAIDTESAFHQACETAGINFDWRCVEGNTSETVVRASRYADLVVVAGGEGTVGAHQFSLADRLVLESGRPILIVPEQPAENPIGTRVLLAWNSRREAVRAAHDALPVLVDAEWVKIVSVNPTISDDHHGEVPGADIARHLLRHGARAEAHSLMVDGQEVGGHLLAWAREAQANLIVMGAYGHAHWRQIVLGGVTTHMIRHTSIPVLMAH